MLTMTTTDVIDLNSPEWLQAKADLGQKITDILANRNVERSPEQVSEIAKDILFESHQVTIMPPPDVPKGKRGPKPNPAKSMAGWAASNICTKHDLGAAGAWDNNDTGERSVAVDIYRLIFAHVKQHIDPEYRGRYQDARHSIEKGKDIKITALVENGKPVKGSNNE